MIFEAEWAHTLQGLWRFVRNPEYSGGISLEVPDPHARKDPLPEDLTQASYYIKIDESAHYTLWGYCAWDDSCGNSFYTRYDQGKRAVFGNSGGKAKGWHWAKGVTLFLEKGTHSLEIQYREDGPMVDVWMLVPDRDFVPEKQYRPDKQSLASAPNLLKTLPPITAYATYEETEIVKPGKHLNLFVHLSNNHGVFKDAQLHIETPWEEDVYHALDLGAGQRVYQETIRVPIPASVKRADHNLTAHVLVDNADVPSQDLVVIRAYDWYFLGPFHNQDRKGFETSFIPEPEVDLEGRYKGSDGWCSWIHPAEGTMYDEFGLIDFFKILGTHTWATGYAYTRLFAEEAKTVTFLVGVDDTLTVWLNGEEIFAREYYRPPWKDGTAITAPLKKGENTILLKVCQGLERNKKTNSYWGMFFRITEDGAPATGVWGME